MAKTNVAVRLEGGKKRVFLRDVDRTTLPCRFTIVKQTEALTFAAIHERNCDSEEQAETYYNNLSKKTPPLGELNLDHPHHRSR